MKKMNRFIALGLVAAMAATALVGCGGKKEEAPASAASAAAEASAPAEASAAEEAAAPAADGAAHLFMFKSVGNHFGELLYQGFGEYMDSQGQAHMEKSPAETTVSAQVALIDEALTAGCASLSISTDGDAGYDEVFKKAGEQNVPIVSVDSAASPDFRITHNGQASTYDIGAMHIRAAVMIVCGKDYDPEDPTMEKAVEECLNSYTGDPITIGVLSAGIDMPVQNGWIACMNEELQKPIYAGKVNELDLKYGDDDFQKSTTQATAFINEGKVDVIVSPTTVGLAAGAETLTQAKSDIKITGLGLPTEMNAYMPQTAEDNAMDFVCPFMFLWDVLHLGSSTAAIQMAVANDGFDGALESSFTMQPWSTYGEDTFTATDKGDGGTECITGAPYIFYGGNMQEWKDVL